MRDQPYVAWYLYLVYQFYGLALWKEAKTSYPMVGYWEKYKKNSFWDCHDIATQKFDVKKKPNKKILIKSYDTYFSLIFPKEKSVWFFIHKLPPFKFI